MRRFISTGAWWTALVVLVWRGMSELLERRRDLVLANHLAPRIARRRAGRVQRALSRAGLVAPVRERVHAAVHVGPIGAADLDDVGLLEAAMRRAARQRAEVSERGVHTSKQPGRLPTVDTRNLALERWWLVPLATLGAVLTVVPLVRPLDSAAPWLALAGSSLACVAWIAARRG